MFFLLFFALAAADAVRIFRFFFDRLFLDVFELVIVVATGFFIVHGVLLHNFLPRRLFRRFRPLGGCVACVFGVPRRRSLLLVE